MEIRVQLDNGEQYAPIKFAEAIIEFYMVGMSPLRSEEQRLINLRELKEVNDYLTVFVNNHIEGGKC